MLRSLCSLALLAVPLVALGCSSGPRMHKVMGNVTYNGKPVEEGDILFVPTTKSLGPDPGKIKNGRFEFLAKEGTHRVEISASRILPGGAKGAGGEPVAEEYLPERYNTASDLTAHVQASGPNQFEFKLEGKKK
jgi:hypothetical protein